MVLKQVIIWLLVQYAAAPTEQVFLLSPRHIALVHIHHKADVANGLIYQVIQCKRWMVKKK